MTKLFYLILAATMLSVAADVTAKQQNPAKKQDKVLICHVGNEAGPAGESYLDDPDCVPNDLNDYFCPDAGKIDLIVVARKAADKHLSQESHYWDGISDYEPGEVGASGDGTEDSDGNGVDDGCEIPTENACPCWDEIELQAITKENQNPISCNYPAYTLFYPDMAMMQAIEEGVALIFRANNTNWINSGGKAGCLVYPGNIVTELSDEDANICISQIYDRCADLDRPVIPNP